MKRNLCLLFFSITTIFILNACTAQTEIPSTPTVVIENPVIVDTPTPAISCAAIYAEPTAAPSSSLFPPASAADLSIGPADAPVTIIEYCDFQSQGCGNMSTVIGELMRNHDDLRFVFRPLPLIGVMDKSDKAILAAPLRMSKENSG